MSDGGKSAGGGIAGLGVVLVVVGFIGYLYQVQESTYWGLSSQTVYPYRAIGTLLLIMGIIVVVIGGIVYAIACSGASSSPPLQIPLYTQPGYQQSQATTQSTETKKYCESCERSIPMDSMLCPYCGYRKDKEKSDVE